MISFKDIDEAIIRRFQGRFFLPLPDTNILYEVLNTEMKRFRHDIEEEELKKISLKLKRCSISDVKGLSKELTSEHLSILKDAKFFRKVKNLLQKCIKICTVSNLQVMVQGKILYEPCGARGKGALEMTFKDLKYCNVAPFRLEKDKLKDLAASLKPSVSEEAENEMKIYSRFF